MAFLAWNDSFSVGNAHLDQQHRTWFEMMAEADRLASEDDGADFSARLRFMADYARDHFRDEERHMEALGFPDLAAHRQVHAVFVEQVAQLQKVCEGSPDAVTSRDILPFIHDWLVFHIMGLDKQYQAWEAHGKA